MKECKDANLESNTVVNKENQPETQNQSDKSKSKIRLKTNEEGEPKSKLPLTVCMSARIPLAQSSTGNMQRESLNSQVQELQEAVQRLHVSDAAQLPHDISGENQFEAHKESKIVPHIQPTSTANVV